MIMHLISWQLKDFLILYPGKKKQWIHDEEREREEKRQQLIIN